MTDVQKLDPTCVPEVVDVLTESFFDYPVMRFVLGKPGPSYRQRLGTLVNFFVMARVFRHEVLLGIRQAGQLVATALVSRPGGPGPDPGFQALREEAWAELGEDAKGRYAAFADACAPFQVQVPHLHLNMIGVKTRARGSGLSRHLIDRVHELSRDDDESQGVTLTTENPSNVSLYQHFGYDILGQAVVGPELTTWGFFRPDSR
jgi:GNAT superfamily N-acetyltransferase